ncbi:MAG: tRNA pseudouridine(38-40) synthase TruA [Omnitrophica WOR_2 bacterium RIFCSPLOWO2_12_FULL_51_24]|nr:MAG: tRNA pseudouridine(38-40) synthase TruA [Omnitrophica WOR_2 bacterium RIFCSPHIGHO2_01_FULL_49_10]OGX35517.1 MAG: tRNA pseudouridine(38-40) synthase TruA [Omnitrophica WOR_2 bacterium RIFCSPLOWO2_02_FULL_50_19]OGX43840.1 MAG: tRNA pseudouridine(38-40) synthase TruA [Omnitrophica WOR_2 bacterium RIFCSPLOWO2_12_FULL_51_24]
MRNILLKIEYDGTNYAGWQYQKNAKSIQETMEAALKRITGRKARLISCGRTDAGVHALGHIANFVTDSQMPLFRLQKALNGVLPKDIVVKEVRDVPLKFNSSRDAKSKLYVYTILNDPAGCALSRGYVRHVPYKLNLNLMIGAAKCLLGRHNFKSFQAADNRKRSSVRTIKRLEIKKKGDLIKIEVEGDGFLYNMVRNIAGTLIEIGRGRFKPGSMKKILKAKDRKLAGPTAPAKGLCLVEVKY